MKVPQLQEFLKDHKVASDKKARKDTLLQRVTVWLEAQGFHEALSSQVASSSQ